MLTQPVVHEQNLKHAVGPAGHFAGKKHQVLHGAAAVAILLATLLGLAWMIGFDGLPSSILFLGKALAIIVLVSVAFMVVAYCLTVAFGDDPDHHV